MNIWNICLNSSYKSYRNDTNPNAINHRSGALTMKNIMKNKAVLVIATIVLAMLVVCVAMYVYGGEKKIDADSATPKALVDGAKANQWFEYKFTESATSYGKIKITYETVGGGSISIDQETEVHNESGSKIGVTSSTWGADWIAKQIYKGETKMKILGKNTPLKIWENDKCKYYISEANEICAIADSEHTYVLQNKNV